MAVVRTQFEGLNRVKTEGQGQQTARRRAKVTETGKANGRIRVGDSGLEGGRKA